MLYDRICFSFTGGAISWVSCLQPCTDLSTTKAKYVATSEACKEAIWLTRLVGDLGITREIPILHNDSIRGNLESKWALLIRV